MAHRPTFFLSSTIYDFRDLRSAIKFSLEERGCRVLASEFNDFGGTSDQHSYDACLSNIEQADFFVLLIGARVGGWYDARERVSITQREYRTAYELHRAGKLRLITFVRDEVWQLREDRKELTRFLAEMDMTDSERGAIARAPSKFANDAEFVSTFIAEVGRNVETGKAVATGGIKPTGNWIHRFRDFRDIHDVLQPLAFTGTTAEEAAYRQALLSELLIVMSRLLHKRDGKVMDPRPALKRGLAAHPITRESKKNELMTVSLKEWNSFTTWFFQVLGGRFETVVIDDALTSTIFLEYDMATGTYAQSPAYRALSKLWDQIRSYNQLATSETLQLIYDTSLRSVGRNTGPLNVETTKVAMLYSLAHRWIDVISLAEALVHHLAGRPFQEPALMPFSPIVNFDEAILKEQVSPAELRAALNIP